MKKCTKCKQYKENDKFSKSYFWWCKRCMSIYHRQYYLRNKKLKNGWNAFSDILWGAIQYKNWSKKQPKN